MAFGKSMVSPLHTIYKESVSKITLPAKSWLLERKPPKITACLIKWSLREEKKLKLQPVLKYGLCESRENETPACCLRL
jgi:hypothetical protein